MATAQLPQYAQIKQRLIREIRSGQWAIGSQFPSEADLVARYKVSRSTLVRSLQELVREGYLYRRQGQGTYVADRRHREAASPLPLFFHGSSPLEPVRASQVLLSVLAGIESALGPGLPGLVLRQTPAGGLDEETRRLIATLKPPVALIVEPSFNLELLKALMDIHCSIWSVNEPMEEVNCIYVDQERAGYLATRHLIETGCRKIALLNGPAGNYWGFAAKFRGFRRALADAGIADDPRLVREADHPIDSEAGRAMLRALLDERIDPDGVVCASDNKAIGALALLQEMGRRVPEDVQIVGIDDTMAQQANPPLTSVALPLAEVGRQAAARARELLDAGGADGSVIALQRIRLQPTLEVRETTRER